MQNFSFSKSQENAFQQFLSGKSMFITGEGGAGKSFLTRHIIETCKVQGRSAIVCAPTGVAALNVGGSTLHRTFGVPMEILRPGTHCQNQKKIKVLQKADIVIIDEISMCRIDVFEFVARTILHCKNIKQVLTVGDFYQLPPVLKDNERDAFSRYYGDKLYAFESDLWDELQLQTVVLEGSMRQKDKALLSALDHIREGIPDFNIFASRKVKEPVGDAITICGTNNQATIINAEHLNTLKESGKNAIMSEASIIGDVKSAEYPTEPKLELCEGARVVMLTNDSDGQWVNGSLGEILRVQENNVEVRIDGGAVASVKKHTWDFVEYIVEYTRNGDRLVTAPRGQFTQFPMRLAWAITIHKSQGQTYDKVNIDLRQIFVEGQAYVALSRCRTLEGMYIMGNLTEKKIMVSQAVKAFMSGKCSEKKQKQQLTEAQVAELLERKTQEAFQDGLKAGQAVEKGRQRAFLSDDPHYRRVSDRVAKEREKANQPPEVRNPRNAGRKPKPESEKVRSKAIRVPESLADTMKGISALYKNNPAIAGLLVKFLEGNNVYK